MAFKATRVIDPRTEQLIRLSDVPRFAPPSPRTGRPLTRAAIYRWATTGVDGIALDTVRISGIIFTSREAVARFLGGWVEPAGVSA